MRQAQPNQINEINAHLDAGGTIMVGTMIRWTKITPKVAANFKKAGYVVLRADGQGYRMQSGKRSVYLFAHQVYFA